ncbi:hypothetical protein GW793_01340 [bacterium]|nr:hypothetical protein [bacterium]
MKHIINLALTVSLAVIMILPFVGSNFILDLSSPLGSVAGVRTVTSSDIQILPNYQDFGDYVSFAPETLSEGIYDDTLSVTVFQGQKASYSGVYTLYNTTADSNLAVTLFTRDVVESANLFSIATLGLRQGTPITLLEGVKQGATVITIDAVHSLQKDMRVLVGTELTRVIAVSSGGKVVVTPLTQSHLIGEEVTMQPVVINQNSVVQPETYVKVLSPGESVSVDVVVWGADTITTLNHTIQIPLSVSIKAVQ